MIVTRETAQYVLAIANMAASKGLPDEVMTRRCPECGMLMEYTENDEHIVIPNQWDNATVILVVGCEGYWVIPPDVVGILKPDWSPPPSDNDEQRKSPTWGPWGAEGRQEADA